MSGLSGATPPFAGARSVVEFGGIISALRLPSHVVMPVIAIVNRKGGSGKSTLATHLAAYCAHKGFPALLGDADFQQSSHVWLRQRERQRLVANAPKIAGWSVDPRNILRAPSGMSHVV